METELQTHKQNIEQRFPVEHLQKTDFLYPCEFYFVYM
jgi:hypothetical protein